MHYLISMVIGYAFGMIQASYFMCRWFYHVDIRTIGTQNAGASNTFIHVGKGAGILVGLLDIGKAFVALFIIRHLFHLKLAPSELKLCLYLGGLFVILGHNFPLFLKFRGGKGTASLIGAFLFLEFKVALFAIGVFVLIILITNYIAFSTTSLTLIFFLQTLIRQFSWPIVAIAFLILLMSLLKHIENYKRISRGEENRL